MSFIEDFKKLQSKIPRLAIINTNSENSAYTNYSTFNRNCYLVSGTHYSEDAYYTQYCAYLTSCMDMLDVDKSELCYECVFSEKCYNCNWSAYLINCQDCDFSWDLTNCQNCLGSELRNCKNCLFSYRIKNGEDVIYGGTHANQIKTSVDIDNCAATMSEELYQAVGISGAYNFICCNCCWFSQNLTYCEIVFNSHDCFGCISRNHTEYEILNIKYPKEEYFRRIEEIKAELKSQNQWGKMWIPATYPFEDTVAAQYYRNF